MTWQAWFTLAVSLGTIVLLARDIVAPASAMMGATIALLLVGIISPGQAFAGFGNPAPITVAALYILARAVEKTGLMHPLVRGVLGGGGGGRRTLSRLLLPSAAGSAFLNNTPIVAMLLPVVNQWSEEHHESPSGYLMPLSFAVILGGVVTAIGTSTNLVVSGLLEQSGQRPMGLFELTPLGLPVMVVGLILLIVLTPVLLPRRKTARADLGEDFREFVVSMEVVDGGPLDGRSIEEAGLRNLMGVFLAEIERDGEIIAPVGPATVLRGRDRLSFVGKADQVVDLQGRRGLQSSEQQHLTPFDTTRHTFFEAVVGAASPLVGKTVKEIEFRSRYQAAVVAIHRSGQRVRAKLGDVRIRLGDTLLLLTDPGFRSRWRDRNDFLLVSQLGGAAPGVTRKAWIVGIITLAIVGVAGLGVLPILQAALVGVIVLIASGVLTAAEARNAVDLDVLIVIAASFGLGAGIQASGLAGHVATFITHTFATLGHTGALLGVVLGTIVLTELVTNNAAAALMFPIGWAAALQVGADPRGFAMAVAVSASASFLTPIGYQTNTMVYGPGGYRFSDYMRLGFPLTLVVIVTIVLLVPLVWAV